MKTCSKYDFLTRVVLIGALIALATAGLTDQRRTQTTLIEFGDAIFHWDTNIWEFVSTPAQGCKLTVTGSHQATMTAPKMSGKLTSGDKRIEWLKTTGPTHITVITKPDKEGQRLKIVATGSQGANYSELTQTVELAGGANADLISLPEGRGEAHFAAEVLKINLSTRTISASKGHLKVITPLEGE